MKPQNENSRITLPIFTFWLHRLPWQCMAFVILLGDFSTHDLRAQTLAEALDATNLVWTTGGTGAFIEWTGQTTSTHDGVDAATGTVQGYEVLAVGGSVWIETTIVGPGRLAFYMSASWAYGYGSFYYTVDGEYHSLYSYGWTRSEAVLGSGSHVVRWTFSSSIDPWGYPIGGSASLDEVSFTPPTAPEITQQPQSLTRALGATASFSASVFGAEPMSYQWRLNGTNLLNATNLTLNITNVQPQDAGGYSLFVSNSHDFTVSSNAILTVLTAPQITQQPSSQTVNADSPATFTVTATGATPLWYQWRLNSNPLGAATTNKNYTDTSVQPTEAGLYSVVVSNTYGSTISSNALLTVRTLPVISPQPYFSEPAREGYWTQVEVSAYGPAPLRYQWRFQGADLPDATNSVLRLSGIRTNQAGPYAVVVSNQYGATLSSNAVLSVIPLSATPALGVALDAPFLEWRTDGYGNWWYAQTNITHDAVDAASISAFYQNHVNGWVGTRVVGPGTLSFYWKADEQGMLNFPSGLAFSIDGDWLLGLSALTGSGWVHEQIQIGPGEHGLYWDWTFDMWGGYGTGEGYLDEVTFIPDPGNTPTIIVNDGSLGFGSNGFGFHLVGASGQMLVVEASTNLLNWLPLQTNVMGELPAYFDDPASINFSRRFYRLRTP
jgi:hypothetical protein